MAKAWTDQEYEITDGVYAQAIEQERPGRTIRRTELLNQAKKLTERTTDDSVAMDLGNLTNARQELGLPVRSCIGPQAHRPKKLVMFLMSKYQLQSATQAGPRPILPASWVACATTPR